MIGNMVFLEFMGLLHSLVEKMSGIQPSLNCLSFVNLKIVFLKKKWLIHSYGATLKNKLFK